LNNIMLSNSVTEASFGLSISGRTEKIIGISPVREDELRG